MTSKRITLAALIAVSFSFFAPVTASADDALMDAYKKEFAFLEAEKAALQKRLKSIDAEADAKVTQARGVVESLQQQILGLRARADDIEDELTDVEEKTITAEERSTLLEETIERAFETLTRHEMEVPKTAAKDIAEQSEQIETMFALAGKLIDRAGKVRKETGEFFNLEGAQEKGTIIRVGNVAAYGSNDHLSGALAPAGAGRFKIWHQDAGPSAKALASNNPLDNMAIFLFESLEKGVEEKKDKTPLEVIESGGIIAWVIVCLGAVGLLMMLVRVWILARASSRTDRLLGKLREAMVNGTREEALQICRKAKGASARVLKATIRNLDRERQHLEDIVSEAILHEAPYIERFGGTILVVAAVAPLLGLLGTVTGMISTFDIITEHGTGDPKMLSGGISEALVTTELGLIVAIPTLLFGTLLSGRASGILQTLERAALQVMNLAEQPEVRDRMTEPAQDPVDPEPPKDEAQKQQPALEVAEEPVQ